jgi:hypothetical protein
MRSTAWAIRWRAPELVAFNASNDQLNPCDRSESKTLGSKDAQGGGMAEQLSFPVPGETDVDKWSCLSG